MISTKKRRGRRRARRRNPSFRDHAAHRGTELAIMGAAAAAPFLASRLLGAPMMPIALALLGGGWFLNGRSFKGHDFAASVAKGAILASIAALFVNFRRTYQLNAGKVDPSDLVAAKNPDLRGIGVG